MKLWNILMKMPPNKTNGAFSSVFRFSINVVEPKSFPMGSAACPFFVLIVWNLAPIFIFMPFWRKCCSFVLKNEKKENVFWFPTIKKWVYLRISCIYVQHWLKKCVRKREFKWENDPKLAHDGTRLIQDCCEISIIFLPQKNSLQRKTQNAFWFSVIKIWISLNFMHSC